MARNSSIEWCDDTWNPIAGCTLVSPGCTNCYAMGVAHRFKDATPLYDGLTKVVNGKPVWTGKIAINERVLTQPLKWKKPRRIFVNSMSDLFHENVPDEAIDRVFAIMALAPHHTFQILTKRPERMKRYLTRAVEGKWAGRMFRDGKPETQAAYSVFMASTSLLSSCPAEGLNRAAAWHDQHFPNGDGFIRSWPLPNVWLGVSIEDQRRADERIPLLMNTPAAIRFVSIEPLIGPVDLTKIFVASGEGMNEWEGKKIRLNVNALCGSKSLGWGAINWVIVGGESGPNARPMHPLWVEDLRDQCVAAGVPFHFKQWGEWLPWNEFHVDINDDDEQTKFLTAIWQKGHWNEVGRPLYLAVSDMLLGIAAGESLEDEYIVARVGKKAAGRMLDGRTWDEFPKAAV